MAERLAIMKKVGFGLRDVGQPCLHFEAFISDAVASLQVLFGKDIEKVLKDAQAYDVKDLEGKACWVENDNMTSKFLRMAKI